MLAASERKRLSAEVGEGDVGSQPQLAGKSLKPEMVRTLRLRGADLGPAEPWFAGYFNAGSAFDGLDDAHQLLGTERPSELHETGREVRYLERARRCLECCFKNICIGQVTLGAGLSFRGTDSILAAILRVEQS